jgi:hypothetical protein
MPIPEETMMKRSLLVCMSLALMLLCQGVAAATGNQLMDGVRANQKIDQGQVPEYPEAVAWGYLTGMLRATSAIMTQTGGICPASTVTKGQLLDITTQWLNRHSDKLNNPDYILIALALTEAFPCPEQ